MSQKTAYNTEDRSNDGYDLFSGTVVLNFKKSTPPFFSTNADGLFETYLSNLPEYARQHYNCNACKSFFRHYGNIVTIDEKGNLKSAMWNENSVPEFFYNAVKAMRIMVESSSVDHVFLSKENTLGHPVLGGWEHLHVINTVVHRDLLKTPGQDMAQSKEDFAMLSSALQEYTLSSANKAVDILNSGTLYRSENTLKVAKWFQELYTSLLNAKPNKKSNIIWLAVGKAPAGFTHVKSSMLGSLLDDIDLPVTEISSRWMAKMDPNNYMRSQVAPTTGNVQQAEKIVEKLGIAASLKRRYATLGEIKNFIWKSLPPKVSVSSGGVFSSVATKQTPKPVSDGVSLPQTVMTWEKFKKTVLPSASKVQAQITDSNRLMALVTASDPESPNILKWDNPFSWYYHGGADAEIRRRVESSGGKYENNEIRVSLMWEGPTDLDVHCDSPTGEHIYYAHKRDRTGGWLDIDANGGRPTHTYPIENIRWEKAPLGAYRFYVHNFCERGMGRTPFKIELEIAGKVYSYSGIALGTDWQQTIFTFNYNKVSPPSINLPNGTSTSNATTWGVPQNEFIDVVGIVPSPNTWSGENDHETKHIFFILKDCKDTSEGKGRGFFNEMLKSDLREVRKTLESYMENNPIEGVENSDACGLGYSGGNWDLNLKVTTNTGSTQMIKIDRWD